MWARGDVLITECPQSYIRPSSLTLLEEHHAWRMSGGDLRGYPARSVEAFTVLEGELQREKKHGER